MTMTFLANGYSVKYVPIEYAKRAGTSKFRFYRDTKQYLLQVLRMVLSYETLRVFVPVGITLLVAAAAKLGYDWHTRDFRLAANTLLIFFAAFQIFVIGFLADLIVRVSKPKEAVPPAMQ
jgi:hypothetical protein